MVRRYGVGTLANSWLVYSNFKSESRFAGSVRFSQDSKKLAVLGIGLRCGMSKHRKSETETTSAGSTLAHVTCAPVFWTTNDKTIAAAFITESDNPTIYDSDSDVSMLQKSHEPKTIYEFDMAQNVGAPFEGHQYHR